ncbi:MAG: bifunctional folylpolyglutamate synthase/dihydrofolate synthase, partial [Candidatus Zixiibacteriota bacterium]
DATNILNPLMCGISQISLDHTSILGATLPRIAREKGGIIKPGAPVALGVMPESARATLRDIARTQRAPRRKLVGERAAMRFARSLRLEGQCQVENLRLALTVVRELRRQGYRIPDRAIHRGLFRVRWRGRFQRLRSPAGATIILDVAHNESGLISVASTFRRLFPGRRARILIGLVKNKRHKNSLAPLKGIAEEFIFTRLPTRRTLEPAELKKALGGFPRRVTVPETPTRAFRYALSSLESDGRGGILLIAGSHYLVGDFLRRSLHRPKRIT